MPARKLFFIAVAEHLSSPRSMGHSRRLVTLQMKTFAETGHEVNRSTPASLDTCSASIGLDPTKFGTHSLRRTKAVLIYRRTGNLRAVQILLGHSKIESTVRYLGIEVDDAIEIAEKIDI